MARVRGSSSSDSWIVRMFQCRIFSCFTPPQQRLEGFNDMEILDEIAEGGFGRVFRCRDRSTGGTGDTGDIVAVKQIELPADITNRASIKINREIELLQQVNHDNIVRLLRHVQTEDRRYVYLVFELLDCDLFQYIRRSRRLFVEPWLRKRFLHQILTGVAYCHANQILHRDLKPKNLLIDESRDIIKLADFGLARPFGDPTGQYTDKMGTRFYTAPEILFDGPYSTPADLWSVGCIFGEMIIGNPIFETLYACQNELEAIFRVLGTPTEATWPGVSRFIDYPKYGKYDTMNLPMIFEAVGPDGLDLLTRMLTLDPDTRISAEAALGHAYFNGLD